MQARLDLVEAARRGEPGAVMQLLRTCQPDLKRFARRTCNNTEDAEDAVQFALWQLYRRVGALRAAATLTAWLFRIVERECYRLLRLRRPDQSLDDLAEDQHPASPELPADLRMDLARAIEHLSAPYREVLVLRDVHELTAPEVAAELGLSLSAVKSRLLRARAQVRERLLGSGYWFKDGMPTPDLHEEA